MKINKFLTLSIIFVIIAVCISSFDDFFRDFLDDSIVILMFYIFGIIGVILAIIALRHHKRESNKFSTYSVFLVTFIAATVLFLLVIPPCQCGSRPRARDAAFKATASSIVPAARVCCDSLNNSILLTTVSEEICSPNMGSKYPNVTSLSSITIDTNCQPDGSFSITLSPGTNLRGNCTKAICTQLGCNYVGC